MRNLLAFGLLGLTAAGLVAPHDGARPTVLAQRSLVHHGPATVDVSADGRFVTFESAVSLVAADRHRSVDIYVLDRSTGRVTLESMTPENAVGDWTGHPRLSGNGRYLVFRGVPQDVAFDPAVFWPQVVLRDRWAGTTTLVSRSGRVPNDSVWAASTAASRYLSLGRTLTYGPCWLTEPMYS